MSRLWWRVAGVLVVFMACSEVPEDPPVPPGARAALFRLYPNDPAISDSAARYLAEGVVLPGQPGARYELSFRVDDALRSNPQLRLYRLFPYQGKTAYVTDQVIQADVLSGRLFYRFSVRGDASVQWLTVLEDSGERWNGRVRDVYYRGVGSGSDSLALNIWVAGAFAGFANGGTLDDLVKEIYAQMFPRYGAAGFKLGSVRILRAHDHPQHGRLFPSREEVVASEIEARFDSLNYGGDSRYLRALDYVLIDHFTTPGMLGLSPLYGMSLREGPGGVIVLAVRVDSLTGFWNDSRETKPVSVREFVNTMIHETGHFFGLRHTTTTTRDVLVSGDASSPEDGIADTPWCYGLERYLTGQNLSGSSDAESERWSRIKVSLSGFFCPDQMNPMFPYAVNDEMGFFSQMQAELLLQNLKLLP